MKVMLDTNILLSALLFPSERVNSFLAKVLTEHDLVLSTYVVDELKRVVEIKFPKHKKDIDRFLSRLSYELVYTPAELPQGLFDIRDPKDYPVLYTAIAEDADVFITGDKDFLCVEAERPKIMTIAQFMTEF